MKSKIIALMVLLTGVSAHAAPKVHCYVLLRSNQPVELSIKVQLPTPNDRAAFLALFPAPAFRITDGGSFDRRTSLDGSVVVEQAFGTGEISLRDNSFINLDQFGSGHCMFTGPATTLLFTTLAKAESPLVRKTAEERNGVTVTSVSVLGGLFSCSSSLYGSPLESPVCSLIRTP